MRHTLDLGRSNLSEAANSGVKLFHLGSSADGARREMAAGTARTHASVNLARHCFLQHHRIAVIARLHDLTVCDGLPDGTSRLLQMPAVSIAAGRRNALQFREAVCKLIRRDLCVGIGFKGRKARCIRNFPPCGSV